MIMKGLGNENVTGVMPLYLFYEHWMIARRRAQPILGFMCTLDVMGFTQDQLNIVPFLVLAKAYEKAAAEPTEMNKRIVGLVEETCVQMLTLSSSLCKSVADQVIGFARQGLIEKDGKMVGQSTRTQDVVKSIRVLIAQLICLQKVNKKKLPEEHAALLTD